VTFLHATDLRQVPFIAPYGLCSGIGPPPLAIGSPLPLRRTLAMLRLKERPAWPTSFLFGVIGTTSRRLGI
jgi:hypothetical protein